MAADPLDLAFTALADRTRRGVIELLRERPHRAGELAEALDVSPPALTRHLRVLREGRLVDELIDDGDGRARVYRLKKEALAPLRRWVDEVESMWQEQLAAFAVHVGKQAKKRRRKQA
jgi:DNA-binding transcriptional ArsR family regulator